MLSSEKLHYLVIEGVCSQNYLLSRPHGLAPSLTPIESQLVSQLGTKPPNLSSSHYALTANGTRIIRYF